MTTQGKAESKVEAKKQEAIDQRLSKIIVPGIFKAPAPEPEPEPKNA